MKGRAYLHLHPNRVDPFFRLQIVAPTALAGLHSLEQAQHDGLSGSCQVPDLFQSNKSKGC
jgi:hypothetical protein